MKKQILKVLLLCSFLASVSVQASFDYDTGDGSEIFKPTVENREEVAAREMAKRENDAKRQEVKQLEYTKEQRKIAAAKAEAVIRKESKGGTVSFDRDNQDSRYNQLRREFLKEGEPSEGTVVSKGEVVSKGVPLQRGKPFNFSTDQDDEREGVPLSGKSTTPRGRMEEAINDAWFKFDQAKTDDVKLSEAKNVLGLSGDQTEATINAAYTQKLNTFIELYQKESRAEGFSGEKVSIIKTRLKAARDFLLKEKTLSSFDFVSAGDFEPVPAVKPQLKLAIKLKLSKTLPEKLSADDVNNINEMYKKLNTEQQAVFVENINRLAKDSESSRPDMSDIITSAFADAEKSYSNSWKNMVVRWFKKITSSEDAYFDTVLEQAKDGDLDSKKLLTRREWFKNEAQKDLKTLTLSQKKDFLKEVQVKANKIAQKINLSFERSHEKTSQSTPAQNKLIGKQQTEAAKNFEKSCDDFLVKSFEPMLSKGEKILSVWDRKDHNLILNIVDFKSKAFDLNQPMLDQVDTLIKDQSLEMPQHRFTIPQFKTEIALKMIDFYLSPDNSNQNNDMQAAIEGASKNIENSGQIVDAIIKNVQDQCETLAATLIPEYKVEFNKKVAAIVTTRFNEFITRDPLALPK